jgi:UPF0755 protein
MGIKHKQQQINGQPSGLKMPKKKMIERALFWVIAAILAIISGVIIVGIIWYNIGLSPLGNDLKALKKVTIPSGSTSSQIGVELEKVGIIRNAAVFDIYVRLNCKNDDLKAGSYRLSPAENVSQIVEHFVKGSVDQFSITFYPGATLVDNTSKDESEKLDVTTVLKRAGYTDQEIKAALNKTYDSPLFASKPASADLEGYIYGETYNFNAGVSVEGILQKTFDEFYSVIQKNDFQKKFAAQGLNLYQGIILASIIQREVILPDEQKQVAQVFYLRLENDMNLGSDVTYQYAADKSGVPRDTDLDSPYNTRRYKGLTPGPISSPGLTALQAVADPASGDYLYFLSGDDDVTYFAKTEAEHQSNITNHCQEKCSTP